uniref:Cell division topological specificity factor MinE n=1 Tax=Haptolina brevifila TaxID=156173 RepID=A0A7S2BB66_9EUKA|mmetsp:Transcript_11159/g.22521  ORF Transcript_11159/g.22521 Transcript_11159/m.22521 type:complete len:180 (+) Transcript_11159:81-620(+)
MAPSTVIVLCTSLAACSALVLTPTVSCVSCAAPPAPRTTGAAMGLMTWLSNMLYEGEMRQSRSRRGRADAAGSAAVSRLKVVLAHDRTGLEEATMTKIRAEIQQVIAKYVIIDADKVQFDLVNDDQLTLVTATFPLMGRRPARVAADDDDDDMMTSPLTASLVSGSGRGEGTANTEMSI